MKEEVYRAVNYYIDPDTGDERFVYSKAYDKPGSAKAHATTMRGGRNKPAKKIGNQYHLEDQPAFHPRGEPYKTKVYDTYFEFVDTWCERAKEWERV